MRMSTPDIIFFILLLAAIIFYIIAARSKKYYSNAIIVYLLLVLVTSSIGIYLVHTGVRNNLFLLHIYTPIEYTILSLLYRHVISRTVTKKIITISIPAFFILSIVFSIFVQKIHENNSFITLIK